MQSAKCKMQSARWASASDHHAPCPERASNAECRTPNAERGITRRELLTAGAAGLAGLALAPAAAWPGQPMFSLPGSPAARSVILLWMDGGPSQVDTFDPKPDA